MENNKNYAIYNTDYDGFWYNRGEPAGSVISWTDSIRTAQLKHTVADTFNVCCLLYEKDMYRFETLVVVEVYKVIKNDIIVDHLVDFENPLWIGGEQKMTEFWAEVEPDLKPLLLRGLFENGLQQMHKVVLAWHRRGL